MCPYGMIAEEVNVYVCAKSWLGRKFLLGLVKGNKGGGSMILGYIIPIDHFVIDSAMTDADAIALLHAEIDVQPRLSVFRPHPHQFTGEMSGPNFWIQRAAGGRSASPSFIGSIAARDGGSRISGHIRPTPFLCGVYALLLLVFIIGAFQVIMAILHRMPGAVGGLFMPVVLAGILTTMNMSFHAYAGAQKPVLRRFFATTDEFRTAF